MLIEGLSTQATPRMTSQEADVPYTYGDPDELLTADERTMLGGS